MLKEEYSDYLKDCRNSSNKAEWFQAMLLEILAVHNPWDAAEPAPVKKQHFKKQFTKGEMGELGKAVVTATRIANPDQATPEDPNEEPTKVEKEREKKGHRLSHMILEQREAQAAVQNELQLSSVLKKLAGEFQTVYHNKARAVMLAKKGQKLYDFSMN